MAEEVQSNKVKYSRIKIPAKLKKSEYDELIPVLRKAYNLIWGDNFENE